MSHVTRPKSTRRCVACGLVALMTVAVSCSQTDTIADPLPVTSSAAPSTVAPQSTVPTTSVPVTSTTAAPFGDGPDPLRSQQTHLAQLGLSEVWRRAAGQGQVIAIVDTGVDLTHPDLAAKLVDGINLVTPGTPPQDDNGHGTHVAGIAAAATGNSIGGSGVAPLARIMPVKVLDAGGSGSTANIAAGIDWAATHGATVINLSLGESGLRSRITKGGQINAALRRAAAAGVVVVAASGNDSTLKRDYRAGVDVIVVNACNGSGAPAAFTNAGDPRAVAAPGVDILSTAPRTPTDIWPSGSTGYERLSGTSMASPIVAGIAALLLSAGIDRSQVASRLESTATNPTNDIRLGAGVVSPSTALA
jgi:subtilisin family serine protease